jgi:hypothetical protein
MHIKTIIYEALKNVKAGNWEIAHEIAQSREGHPDYDRLHAFLHRMEGDHFNAQYWYKRCNLTAPKIPIQQELEELLVQYRF